MKKQPATRNYKFSDGFLKQKCDDVATSVTRDQTEFTPRGITAANVTAFETQSNNFGDIPTDEELQGAVSAATETKDDSAEQVRVAIRTVRTMAENKWGESSARYRTYDFKEMSRLPDEDLVRLGKRVIRVGTNQLPDLVSEGLTAAFLTALGLLVTDFDKDIDKQNDAEEDRDIATEDRIEAGNDLYKVLVRICNTGKDIWESRDEAKYNDYVIYDTPSGGPEPPPVP
ncbi:MAG: hypothetical protein ABIT08_07495 [Bacteroidia bacterium]